MDPGFLSLGGTNQAKWGVPLEKFSANVECSEAYGPGDWQLEARGNERTSFEDQEQSYFFAWSCETHIPIV